MSTAVFFIGGWNAQPNQVADWVRDAQKQKASVAFRGFSWPDGVDSWPDTKVVRGWRASGKFDEALKAIKASTAETIYIVGHSSGCGVANELDRIVHVPDRTQLVCLDGFAPDPNQLSRWTTQVWSAVSGVHTAKNYPGLKKLLKYDLEEYTAKTDCTKKWALHFSLVNAAATDDLIRELIQNGYKSCEANLCWL